MIYTYAISSGKLSLVTNCMYLFIYVAPLVTRFDCSWQICVGKKNKCVVDYTFKTFGELYIKIMASIIYVDYLQLDF